MKLQYPVLIEQGDENTAWGIIVPDLPGCFSAADNQEDILNNTREAILLHLSEMEDLPVPSSLADIEPDGMFIGFVDVDISKLEGPAKRINITVPTAILSRIDAAAKARGLSRSGYMTEAALKEAS